MITLVPKYDEKRVRQVTPEDVALTLGEPVSPRLAQWIKDAKLSYVELNQQQRDAVLIECLRVLLRAEMPRAGEDQRLAQWEKGWGENFEAFTGSAADLAAIMPKYFNKYDVARWKGEVVKGINPDFEYQILALLLEWEFEKYLPDAAAIYEFGCGTGQNLLRARKANSTAKITGLDWATPSQKIIARMVELGVLTNAEGINFNFFKPNNDVKLAKDAVVYTNAALEQVADRHTEFVEYLIRQKPKLVFHLEPISEVFEPETNLLDAISDAYYKKRNYLAGFLTYLRKRESEGAIKILKVQRTHLGHLMTDGYTHIAWKPI